MKNNRIYALALISLGLVAVILFVVMRWPFGAASCGSAAAASATSPMGTWVAERFDVGCNGSQDFRLSLRRPTQSPKQWRHFFLSLTNPDAVGFRWLDETHLLIVSHRDEDISQKPASFDGISLVYSTYPARDPDRPRDPASFAVSRHDVSFQYQFEFIPGYGDPGADCVLYLTADGRPEINQIQLRLSADKVLAAKATVNGKETVLTPEHTGFGILFSGGADYSRPIAFATSASFESVPVAGGWNGVGRWIRSNRPVRLAAGGFSPAWQIAWSLGKPEIGTVIDKIRSGRFDVKVGFWLDDAETIYSNSAPGDLQPVNDFEQCMADNAIVETKP